jgi:hypothetical protein
MNIGSATMEPAQTGRGPEVRENSGLVNYALRGLDRCWLPEQGRWSHIRHLDGRSPPNQSVPHSDVFYTLNVLLGMSRVSRVPAGLDLSEIYERNARLLPRLPVRKYAYGMALWAAAELGFDVPETVAREVRTLLEDETAWGALHAQDLGMLLTGVAAQARAGHAEWGAFAAPLFRFLKAHFRGESGLFQDTPTGLRRRFASFATQVYLSIACFQYGELTGDAEAVALGSACVRKLIALQGPQGEWPWFYDAATGRVLDFYEVYSVHQYGMAPALLEWAELHDVPGATEALILGFKWVLGDNQLGRSMLAPDGLSLRSQIRKGERDSKIPRMLRAVANMALGRSSGLIDQSRVGLRLECRSYELGWILWAFGRRADLPGLTGHAAFDAPPA